MADIKEILKQYWGYDEFRSLQEEIIHSVIAGYDTLALMPTGGGKSITYQVAALTKEGVCVVITPLIALMKDQVEELHKRNIPAEAIYTGMTSDQIESAVNKTLYAGVKFLYISPERLASEVFRAKLRLMKICLFAVDEAHCISQWGYDFRPSYLRIAEIRTFFPDAPVLALTATATPVVADDIQNQLKFVRHNVLSKSFRRDNISYVVRKVNDKPGELLNILLKIQECAIIYVRKRSTAEELAGFLNSKGIKSDFYHAGLASLQREKKQENWKNNAVPVIVATNAFGMGIDKPDVRIVVHFDIPDSLEAYFQEAGRAGRDGKKAYAVLLCSGAAVVALKARIEKGFPEKKYIRQVYEALGNFFQLEEGEGLGRAFEFDRDIFVKNFKLDYVKTLSSINILQVGGYLECTTDVNSRSRICFIVQREHLYRFDTRSELQDRLLEVLMRSYAGIFVQYIFISEQYIAESLGVSRQQVYEALIQLVKRRIISYVPGNDRPYIVYHQPRLPLTYVTIGRDAYETRKQNYALKINKMLEYLEACDSCRQLFLMEYFGQREKEPCGACDLCLGKKRSGNVKEVRQIDQAILNQLQQQDTDIKELMRVCSEHRDQALIRIRILLDNEVICYKTSTVLGLKVK